MATSKGGVPHPPLSHPKAEKPRSSEIPGNENNVQSSPQGVSHCMAQRLMLRLALGAMLARAPSHDNALGPSLLLSTRRHWPIAFAPWPLRSGLAWPGRSRYCRILLRPRKHLGDQMRRRRGCPHRLRKLERGLESEENVGARESAGTGATSARYAAGSKQGEEAHSIGPPWLCAEEPSQEVVSATIESGLCVYAVSQGCDGFWVRSCGTLWQLMRCD